MKNMPEIWSNFDQVVSVVTDLKLDLQTKSTAHVKSIVQKIEQSEQIFQDVKTKNYVLIHAILLYISKDIGNYEYTKLQQNMKEYELIKQICIQLSPEALYVLMQALFNELRFASRQTLFFVFTIQRIFSSCQIEFIEEMIVKLLIERVCIFNVIPFGLKLLLKLLIKEKLQEKPYILKSEQVSKTLDEIIKKINSLKSTK